MPASVREYTDNPGSTPLILVYPMDTIRLKGMDGIPGTKMGRERGSDAPGPAEPLKWQEIPMSIPTADAAPVKPARKPRPPKAKPTTCRLSLTIGDVTYNLRPLPVDAASDVAALIRLRKPDGAVYHCHRDEYGAHCDCP